MQEVQRKSELAHSKREQARLKAQEDMEKIMKNKKRIADFK